MIIKHIRHINDILQNTTVVQSTKKIRSYTLYKLEYWQMVHKL